MPYAVVRPEVGEYNLMTVTQVRKATGLSLRAIHSSIHRGEIPAVRLGQRFLVRRSVLDDLAAGRLPSKAS